MDKLKGKRLWIILAVILAVILIPFSYFGYIYASSPLVIREPLMEHYHFRMQVIVDGKAVNFAEKKFQEGYAKDNCNALLTEHPIHFHDSKDQFVHIHWEGVTGGMVLKYYGWNYIGGPDGAMGYRMDKLSDIKKVPTHGNVLPAVPDGAKFYVYTGDEKSYQGRTFYDWEQKDLEDFFGVTSNMPAHEINMQKRKSSLLDGAVRNIFPKAYAHDGVEHPEGEHPGGTETEAERLTRINNLLGNVVIFVQQDRPSPDEIKERFNDLEPLGDSTCGG
jgi:hypothetical protein